MSDILKYKFYLNFKNEGSFGRIEITEPIGFDGASFTIDQEDKRYGRDAYRINEEINLNFYKGNFDTTAESQQLPNGTVIYNLTQGFDYLIDCYFRYGFETNVDFEIELGDTVFIPSNLDFQTAETDELTYFSCKALQESSKQLIKRRSDIVTNIFSLEDLDGNEVTPAQTENILLKAKPIRQISKFNYEPVSFGITNFGFQQFAGFPLFNNIDTFGIDDTLTAFETSYTAKLVEEPGFLPQYRQDITVIRAQSDLTNIKISIRNLSFTSFGDDPVRVNKALTVNYGSSYVTGEFETITLVESEDDVFSLSSQDYDVTIPFVPNGGFIYVQYTMLGLTPSGGATPIGSFGFNLTSGTLEINATSTAIDSIIKGVRYVDVFKENIKRINGFSLDAVRYDFGGEYYDQYAFTGNLIKQRDDVAFPVKFKTITEDLSELNSDYQILSDKIYIGQYQDFYPNKEIGVFLTPPDDSFKSVFNERYAINEIEYNYKNFEQDREEENTIDAIHTENQRLLSNSQVENTKTINIDLIRDPYKIESTRKLGLKETTSTTDDDKMFVIDTVPLSPTARGSFSSVLANNIASNGNLQLRRTDLFRWDLIGIAVGGEFNIISGENEGNYTIVSFTDTILTLTGGSPTFTGETFTQVDFPYSGINLVNRTNEGLVFFDNLINGDDFSNLKYSIRRNLKTWETYLSTSSIFNSDGAVKSTYFKNNGDCITRFSDETENIQENEDILNSELPSPILEPKLYETRLVAPFTDMSNVVTAVNTINDDNTIGGFIRCIDNNGRVLRLYPKKQEYIPSTETLNLNGEKKFDGIGVDIVISGDVVTINEVGYSIDVLSDPFYEFDGDYFKIYDINRLPVINPTRYDDITVNGLSFDSSSELLEYLINN